MERIQETGSDGKNEEEADAHADKSVPCTLPYKGTVYKALASCRERANHEGTLKYAFSEFRMCLLE